MAAPIKDCIKGWVVDQQLQSPLFSHIPPEIRLLIFEFALAPPSHDPAAHDFRIRYDHADPRADGVLDEAVEAAEFTDGGSEGEDSEDDEMDVDDEDESSAAEEEDARPFLSWDLDDDDSDDESFEGDPTRPCSVSRAPPREWLRPDNVDTMEPTTTLLLTCRRVYLEARNRLLTPGFELRLVDGFHSATRYQHPGKSAMNFYSSLSTQKRNSVLSARLFTGNSGSAGLTAIEDVCRSYVFRRIEHLRITINHPTGRQFVTDMSDCDPFNRGGFMSKNMRQTTGFGHGPPALEAPDAEWEPPVAWGNNSWADLFRYLPRLRILLIDFETHEEMRRIVKERTEWAARVWRFPLWSGRPDGCTYLSAQGNPVWKTSWRGCADQFSSRCPHCRDWVAPHHTVPNVCMCNYAGDRLQLYERDLGPRMYRWTVMWTPRVGRPWVEPPGYRERPFAKPDGRWEWEEGEEIPVVSD